MGNVRSLPKKMDELVALTWEISGDFNHARPETIKYWIYFMPTSRERSDHNLDHLLPVYKRHVCSQLAVSHTVRTWSDETSKALKDCFDTETVWEELCNPHGEDTDNLTDCITDYISFFVENTVPTSQTNHSM